MIFLANQNGRVCGRDLGLWFGDLSTGMNNDLTDVPEVLVGHVSLIRGEGKVPGQEAVRTGVTAILPHIGNLYRNPCRAGICVFNGFGKSVGIPFIQETGLLNSPILLTNTLSVNDVAHGVLTYLLGQNPEIGNDARAPNPVVFECDDSYLNDIRGRHVKPWDAILAIQRAGPGPLRQGNVGAGVGMSCFQLKGGIGSASRIIRHKDGREYILGMLALANFGLLEDLLINGVPVGKFLLQGSPVENLAGNFSDYVPGSLIFVGVTNAPLSSSQLAKVAARSALGQARTGSISRTGSGDFALLVSNAQNDKIKISDWELDNYYLAVVEAGAESIWNALFFAEALQGRNGHSRRALPIPEALQIIRKWSGGLTS